MTEYINSINVKGTNIGIGGEIADGQWIQKRMTVFSSTKFTETGEKTYTVSNYLPDNTYYYEVLVTTYNTAGNTSIAAGDTSSWWFKLSGFSGTLNGGYGRCTSTSYQIDSKHSVIPAKQTSGTLTITVNNTSVGSNGSGNCGMYLTGYRRLGTNP